MHHSADPDEDATVANVERCVEGGRKRTRRRGGRGMMDDGNGLERQIPPTPSHTGSPLFTPPARLVANELPA